MIRGPGDSIADPRWGPQMQMALPIFAGYFRHAKERGEGEGRECCSLSALTCSMART